MNRRRQVGSTWAAQLCAGRAARYAVMVLFASGCHLLVDTDHIIRLADAGAATSTASGSGGADGGSSAEGAGGSAAAAEGGAGGAAASTGAASTGGSGGSGGSGGTPCAADTVAPGTPVAVATGQTRPSALAAADADYLYWINEAESDLASDGAVMRVDKRGCENPVALVSGLGRPRSVRTFTMNVSVFFTNDAGPAADVGVLAVPKSGGPHTQIDALGGGPLAAAGGLYSEAWESGQPTALRKHSLMPIETGACFLYQAAASGSRINALIPDQTQTGIFFVETQAGTSAVRRVDNLCGAPVPTDLALDQPAIREIDQWNDDLYWITADAVYTTPKTATPATAPVLVSPLGVELDSLAALPPGLVVTAGPAGTVKWIHPGPGAAEDVATNQGGPHGIRGSEDTLFWTNRDSGEVMRLDGWAD